MESRRGPPAGRSIREAGTTYTPQRALPLVRDPGGDLGPRGETQLLQDVAHVVLDRALGDGELRRDPTVRESPLDEEGDLPLATGEPFRRFTVRTLFPRGGGVERFLLGEGVLESPLQRHRLTLCPHSRPRLFIQLRARSGQAALVVGDREGFGRGVHPVSLLHALHGPP